MAPRPKGAKNKPKELPEAAVNVPLDPLAPVDSLPVRIVKFLKRIIFESDENIRDRSKKRRFDYGPLNEEVAELSTVVLDLEEMTYLRENFHARRKLGLNLIFLNFFIEWTQNNIISKFRRIPTHKEKIKGQWKLIGKGGSSVICV